MKQKKSIVKTVFGTIDTIISTTQGIHQNIAGIRDDAPGSGVQKQEHTARVYDAVKTVSGKVEDIVLGFFK